MSTSGQADQNSETNKDEEPEISSTTSENEGLKETDGTSNQNSAHTAIDPKDTETSGTVKIVASDVPSSSSDEIPVTDAVAASAAKIQEGSEIMHDGSELRIATDCDVGSTTVSSTSNVIMTAEAGPSDITKETGMGSPKPGGSNDKPEIMQAKCDKDSSFEDDLVLRLDEDYDADDGAIGPPHTDYVLEMLNKELGEDVLEKPDTFKITSEEGTTKSVNDTKSDKNEEKDVIKAITANDSFEESQKIILEIDSSTQDGEIDETMRENPVIADESVNQFEHNKISEDSVELEKLDIEKSKPATLSIELPLKPLTKENEEMDVNDSGDITQEEEIKEKSDILNIAVTVNDSIENSLKIIAEIDSLTQDDKIDKITDLSSECENPGELVNQLENNKTPKDAVKFELELTKENEEMDVDESGDITQEDEIKEKSDLLNAAVTVSDSCEQSQKTVPQINSLTRDEIDKTAALSTVTADEINKQLENIEIPKDESIESENPNMEELVTKTVSIEIPFKPLTTSVVCVDEEMDIDKTEENEKGKEEVKLTRTATVSFEECQKTKAEFNSLAQDDKKEKTGESPSESDHQPVDELESKKPAIEEFKPETKVFEVLPKQLSKDDKDMDLDHSNDVDKDISTIVDCTAKVTKPQENTLDSVQKDNDESIKDKEVLDNVEEKQDISNISHDIIAEVLKPAETVTSEYDISSTDKTILIKDTVISTQDEQNKAIEDITETSQPVDNKESDAFDTIQDLDDKLSTVQSVDTKSNDTQKICDTATSVQDDKKSSDEHITHKLSVAQAIDDKVTSTQEMDDKATEAENIMVNTETKDQSGVNASMIEDSLIDTTISPNKHHRINKPNVMLDIPTQEFSDIEAELSDLEINDDIEKPAENPKNIENPTNIEETTAESNKIVTVTTEISGTATPTIELDATTSKLNITTVSPIKLKPASSKDVKIHEKSTTETQDILTKIVDEHAAEKSSQEVEKSHDNNLSSFRQGEQPSTNIGDEVEKLTTDDADEVQESDTLGLLAESTRVPMNMDDDIDDDEDEAEELEPDDNENDNDDDEDFDPYDESNSQMLEDLVDTDESNPATGAKTLKSKDKDADERTNKQPDEQPDKITNILERVLGNKSELKQRSMGSILNYVEVEGSSDSDDIEEISNPAENLISVKVPAEVDVMLTSGAEGGISEMHSNKDEVVISVPKPQSLKVAKINTSEVTIKSASKNLESIQIPETRSISDKNVDEVFDIDSDDEEEKIEDLPKENERDTSPSPISTPQSPKCINPHCKDTSGVYSKASRGTIAYYSLTRRSGVACRECMEIAGKRSQALVDGIKDLRPLLELDMSAPSHQLVEISDSDEDEEPVDESEKIGEKGARFVLDNLEDVINEIWIKFDMERRLKETEAYINDEIDRIAAGAEELNKLLDDVQIKTDAIRTDFYKDYEPRIRHTGGIVIHDTPFRSYIDTEKDVPVVKEKSSNRYPKRRSASTLSDPPAKKHAAHLQSPDKDKSTSWNSTDQAKADDDKDLTVVKLSAESAPASLPPLGELARPPLCVGMTVYAMRHAFGTWNKAKILEIVQEQSPTVPFTQCRVKFEHKVKSSCKVLAARCIAYCEPSEVRYGFATRVVALFKDPQSTRMDAYYAGVVAEIPNPVNNFRYLIFFDDGYAQYVQHADTRLVCQASALVWEEVHPFIHDFVRNYFKSHPARAMVRLKEGEQIKTEWNGKWWSSKVLKVDASIALIHFDHDGRTEWIYRGSTRLEPLYLELLVAKAGGRNKSRLPTNRTIRTNMPCVEYTRSEELAARAAAVGPQLEPTGQVRTELRAVARKSTTDRRTPGHQGERGSFDTKFSRVIFYTPKYSTKPLRMEEHTCGPECGERADILPLHQLRTYNPLSKPLLSGWERQTTRYNGTRVVAYRAPCGRRLRNMEELHRWLIIQDSELSVDLFDFTPGTHCLAEFCLDKLIVGKKDLSHGRENVPVPCVNCYDGTLPDFCMYNTERTPTAGVPLNLDPDFLCGCDCTDDCQDKSKCACWQMTLEGARTIGLEGDNIGYEYRRLLEPLPSGIYECNSRCQCRKTCLNRVAQHPLQMKLQVFKTENRGWGIRALNDVPRGAFLCVYAGNLLTDATANLDGLNEGDEYLAELDYIEVVEGLKEGYEEDVPSKDKALDKQGIVRESEADSESESSQESEEEKEGSERDDDFQPNAYFPQPQGDFFFQKSLRKREKAKKKEEEKQKEEIAVKKNADCITISDDEEVREPSRFTADDVADNIRPKSRISVRKLYGKDEACYIMDAKVQGNIGRYLNHSCQPNVFVQNVFVDTHDPRFPWVAFFALSSVVAGSELTWNYNYDVGSVPGKILYCFCGAKDCRGRLL